MNLADSWNSRGSSACRIIADRSCNDSEVAVRQIRVRSSELGSVKHVNASARKRILIRSVMDTYFDKPQVQLRDPGARNAFRPKFPKVCAAGVENAAVLIQLVEVDPLAGVSETPET